MLCSIVFCSMKICSVHEHPGRIPACSSLRILSIASLSRFKRTEQKTLPTTDNSVMPRQSLQSLIFPFFGILTITSTPFLHSTGTCPASQQESNSLARACTVASPPHFSISPAISSNPAALLFFS